MSSEPAHFRDFTTVYAHGSRNCGENYERLLRKSQLTGTPPFLLLLDTLPEKHLFPADFATLCSTEILNKADIIAVIFDTSNRNSADQLNSWELLNLGIRDIYFWTDEKDFINYLDSTLSRKHAVTRLLDSPLVKNNLVGDSSVWRQFLSSIIEVSLFSKSSLLLIGDSGTGKELISKLIHAIDTRDHKKDLVVLDCTTIVSDLSGSEFFGHEKGSYTNAHQGRDGAFALANNGTLFLDEIGELPLPLQAGLLRVIQERKYKKLGSNTWQQTDFRLVCATHRNLRQYIEEHKFRQDLFFRISDFEFRVPSLSQRPDDIPVLSHHFLREFHPGKEPPAIDDSVMEFLVNREYPGNVRELRQLIKRICLRHVNHKRITPGEIPLEDRHDHGLRIQEAGDERYEDVSIKKAILLGASLRDLKNKAMDDAIKAALELTNGDKKSAADKLGITLRAVQQFKKRTNGAWN